MKPFEYEPINQLKQIAENVWIADGEKIDMSFGPIKAPFPTRMTVIKLKNSDLWIHSPINPTEKLIKQLNSIGKVTHLISPNKLHYAYIAKWQELFPSAVAWASPGVVERASSRGIEINFDRFLEDSPPAEWESEINQLIFTGSKAVEEVVFYHLDSQVLILTDLIENFDLERAPNKYWGYIYKIAGISAPKGKTPIDFKLTFVGNKNLVREHVEQIIDWHPQTIIISHGDIFTENGVEEIKRAFSWALQD